MPRSTVPQQVMQTVIGLGGFGALIWLLARGRQLSPAALATLLILILAASGLGNILADLSSMTQMSLMQRQQQQQPRRPQQPPQQRDDALQQQREWRRQQTNRDERDRFNDGDTTDESNRGDGR